MLYYKNKIVNSIIKGNKILRKIAKSLYIIPLEKFGIYNDDTNPTSTTKGINSALLYAKSKGYKRVKLPSGTYSIDTAVVNEIVLYGVDGYRWTQRRKGISMQSDMEFIIEDATLKMIPTYDPYYSIISISGCNNSKIKGGTIIGDKLTHDYGKTINLNGGELELGEIDDNGVPLDSDTSIRTINFIDHIEYTKNNGERYDGGLPSLINVFPIINTTNNTADGGKLLVYCYDANGVFLGKSDNNRYGTHNLIDGTIKIKIVIPYDIRTDAVIGIIGDVTYYNPEFPAGIMITASNNITIENTKIYDCCGDCIQTLAPPIKTTVDNLIIKGCTLESSRRQGISFTATGENYLIDNCKIGKIQGTDPQAGIDIEHYDYVRNVVINGCDFYDNKTFDIVLYNGNDIEIKNCNFNGGIGETYAYNVSVHDNRFVYYDAPWLDKKHKGWAYSPSATDGYTMINDNYFEGYSMGGVGIQSKKDTKNYTSLFTRNTLVNCFSRLFGNVENNIYNGSDIYYVTTINCNNEKFINTKFNGEGVGTSVTRTFNRCYFENSVFKGASKQLAETVFDNCEFKYNNATFCDAYGSGVYTVKNSIITNEYTENIPFIHQQGCTATFRECVMNLSVTQFIWANYNIFNLINNEITFNQSYTDNNTIKIFNGGNNFDGNNFYKDFDIPKAILPTSTNSTINGETFTDSIEV